MKLDPNLRSRPEKPGGSRDRRPGWLLSIAGVIVLSVSAAFCQPRLITETPSGYQVGDQVDGTTLLLDNEMRPRQLKDLIEPETKVVVLIIFGAGFATPPEGAHRGPFWCEDSFDDLSVQRALYSALKNEPVQFIPVATPPVYNPAPFGWEDNVFLDQPDESEAYKEAVRSFIAATERQVESGLIPFPKVYYDPKFRLAQNKKQRELGPGFGKIYDWQGKLKWSLDSRRYGTPTLWILDGDRTVLTEPLFGNDYDSDPPEINYEFRDTRELIEKWLRNQE